MRRANDYLSIVLAQSGATAAVAVDNVEQALDQLASRGATKYVFIALPTTFLLKAFTDCAAQYSTLVLLGYSVTKTCLRLKTAAQNCFWLASIGASRPQTMHFHHCCRG